ncbi:MAG: polysaccharide biosynthesis protein [Actinobacteria bacterium]|nr:polysaccharide biosynthesis protein [Actinomycetota bacterium]
MLKNKTVVITGGTGSLGRVLVKKLLSEELGRPKKIIVFSRDEAKQHTMRLEYQHKKVATDEIIYNNFKNLLQFVIGDIRDYHSVCSLLKEANVVFNAAALKQVPTCEYFPFEAVQTNIIGAENIIRAIKENNFSVENVIGISTDKACKPVNIMGMTKAIQERIFIRANLDCPKTTFVCVRYGNILSSRGSVLPLFFEQIKIGGPVTVTTPEMTRFLLTLDEAVDTIFTALKKGKSGETYVPKAYSAKIIDIAKALIGEKKIKIIFTGIRPGEKIHESLVSEEEGYRTIMKGRFYIILPILPEIGKYKNRMKLLKTEYNSKNHVLNQNQVQALLSKGNFQNDFLND